MHGTEGQGQIPVPAILRRSAGHWLGPLREERQVKGGQESTPKAHHHLEEKYRHVKSRFVRLIHFIKLKPNVNDYT